VEPILSVNNPKEILEKGLLSISPYGYVRNNPLNRFDPNGKEDYSAMFMSGLRMLWGKTAFDGGLVLTAVSGASAELTLGASLLGMGVGMGLATYGASEVALGIQDYMIAVETPDGMDAAQYSTLIEMVSGELGAGKTSQKVLKLGVDILTGGKNIPKYLLNDKIVKASIEAGKLSKDVIELLNAEVERQEQLRKKEEERRRKEDEIKERTR